jgi:hypothetical protein
MVNGPFFIRRLEMPIRAIVTPGRRFAMKTGNYGNERFAGNPRHLNRILAFFTGVAVSDRTAAA